MVHLPQNSTYGSRRRKEKSNQLGIHGSEVYASLFWHGIRNIITFKRSTRYDPRFGPDACVGSFLGSRSDQRFWQLRIAPTLFRVSL